MSSLISKSRADCSRAHRKAMSDTKCPLGSREYNRSYNCKARNIDALRQNPRYRLLAFSHRGESFFKSVALNSIIQLYKISPTSCRGRFWCISYMFLFFLIVIWTIVPFINSSLSSTLSVRAFWIKDKISFASTGLYNQAILRKQLTLYFN